MDLNTPFVPPDLYPGYLPPMDLADGIKGMYRVLDLISESGSNGHGKGPSSSRRGSFIGFDTLIWQHD
jgi:hypothetical protein